MDTVLFYYFYFGRTMICLGIVYALCLGALHGKKNICMTHLHIIQKQIRIATMYTRLHLDPVSTALDLIDSVNGDIKNERDNLEEGHEVIVFYSGDLVYLITNTDGQTRVKRYVNNQN